MSNIRTKVILPALVLALAAGSGPVAAADNSSATDLSSLQKQVDQLQKELKATRQAVDKASQQAQTAHREATASDNAYIKWRVAGSVVANYTAGNTPGQSNSFMGGAFMPIFLVRYKDLLELESHLEFRNDGSGTTTSLEYAQLDLFATDWMTVVAGKFLSPVGQFQQALHPAWVNKLPDRPAGFVEDGGAEPLTDVGIQLRGGVPLGSTATANYALYVGNGPQLTDEGLSLEGFSHDNNDGKAVGGRLGFRPWPALNLGVSAMTAGVQGLNDSGTNADYRMLGADFAYTPGALDLRGELISSRLDSAYLSNTEKVPETKWNLWYVQAAYRLSGLTDNPILSKFEPVVQYGRFKVSGGADEWHENAERRTTAGLDYWFGPTLVAKVAYENRRFDNKQNADVYRAQLAFGF